MIKHEIEFSKMGARAFTGTGSPKTNQKMKNIKKEEHRLLFQEWQILSNLGHLNQQHHSVQERKNRRFQ